MTAKTRFSASVVTYDSDVALLDRMLHSLCRSVKCASRTLDLEAELFVVINDELKATIDGVKVVVDHHRNCGAGSFHVTIIEGHGNVGYGRGQNLAIAAARSEYHLLLNPDIVMEEGTVLDCLRFMADHSEVAMLAPQGFDPSGEYARLAKRTPSVLVLLLRALAVRGKASNGFFRRRVARYTYGDELPSPRPQPIVLASGCFMFCRTAVLQKVNGFDERFFLYFEDYDLSLRVHSIGEIVEVPFARITHYGGHTIRRDLRRIAHFVRSGMTYFNVHGWQWL